MAYKSEAQTWQEMADTLQEVYELQEMNLPQNETGRYQRANAVVIRIQLAPARGAIIGNPQLIVGALGTAQAPFSGKTIVPVKEIDAMSGEVSQGLVYAPEIGSNELEFAFLGKNVLKKAGGWLVRQLTKMPQIAQRVQSVKAMVGGKPCPGYQKSFMQRVGRLLPKHVNFKFNRGEDGKWTGNLNYLDQAGRNVNIRGGGGRSRFNLDVDGQGANGQTFGGNFGYDQGQWSGDANYQGQNGNNLQFSGQGHAGQNLNVDGNANFGGNYFDASASHDGQNFGGHGIWSGPGGNQFAGGAIAGNADGFHGIGAYRSPNMQGNVGLNYQREHETSLLGEVFYEMDM